MVSLAITIIVSLLFLTLLILATVVTVKWDTFRIAYDLAEQFKKTQRQVEELSSEWADTLDLLKAREERERKRARRALGSGGGSGEGNTAVAEQPEAQRAASGAGEFFQRQRQLWGRVKKSGAAT